MADTSSVRVMTRHVLGLVSREGVFFGGAASLLSLSHDHKRSLSLELLPNGTVQAWPALMPITYTLWLDLDPSTSSAHTHSPIDIFAPLPAHRPLLDAPEAGWTVQDRKQKHKRRANLPLPPPSSTRPSRSSRAHADWRYGPIQLDWYDMPAPSFTLTTAPAAPPTTGSTSLPSGTLHLFRHPSSAPLPSDDPSNSTLLAIPAIPASFSPSDLLAFLAPARQDLAHIRVLRDALPDRSVALLKFHSPATATAFAASHAGKPFYPDIPTSEICQLIAIDEVRITPTPTAFPPPSQPSPLHPHTPPTGLELPTCPVCLDRMDSALTGLITVPCTHTFHCACLERWSDSRCPVCRASTAPSSRPTAHPATPNLSTTRTDSPSPTRPSHCADCPATTQLWICLICGNLGCGRYAQAHASAHFAATQHPFALELETQRVWDYAGDTYVHRLIRNRADGKVVELPSASAVGGVGVAVAGAGAAGGAGTGAGPGEEEAHVADKMEAMGVEYGLLLSAQLEAQRTWYEARIDEVERRLEEVVLRRSAEVEGEGPLRMELKEREAREKEERAGRERAERRAAEAAALARRLQGELQTERALSTSLVTNLQALRGEVERHAREREGWERRMGEMEEQVRDLMVFVEAREKILGEGQGAEGGEGGDLVMPPPPPPQEEEKGTPGKGKKKRTSGVKK